MSTIEEKIDAYFNGVQALSDAVTGMTKEQVRARPVPGKWSTLEVLGFSRSRRPCFYREAVAQHSPGSTYAAHPDALFLPRSGCTTQPGVDVRGAPRGVGRSLGPLYREAVPQARGSSPTRGAPSTATPGCAVQPLRGKNRERNRAQTEEAAPMRQRASLVRIGTEAVPRCRNSSATCESFSHRGRLRGLSGVGSSGRVSPSCLGGQNPPAAPRRRVRRSGRPGQADFAAAVVVPLGARRGNVEQATGKRGIT
jgi:hypothetical protein